MQTYDTLWTSIQLRNYLTQRKKEHKTRQQQRKRGQIKRYAGVTDVTDALNIVAKYWPRRWTGQAENLCRPHFLHKLHSLRSCRHCCCHTCIIRNSRSPHINRAPGTFSHHHSLGPCCLGHNISKHFHQRNSPAKATSVSLWNHRILLETSTGGTTTANTCQELPFKTRHSTIQLYALLQVNHILILENAQVQAHGLRLL